MYFQFLLCFQLHCNMGVLLKNNINLVNNFNVFFLCPQLHHSCIQNLEKAQILKIILFPGYSI